MKIFYFSGTKLPSENAHSVHVMKMAQAFAKAGHDVTLYAKSINNASQTDIFEIYDVQPIFDLHLTPYIPIPVIGSGTRLMKVSNAVSKKGKPDLAFGHDLIALAMLARRNVPVMLELYELPRFAAHTTALKSLIYSRNLKGIVTVSDVLKTEILKKYPEIESEEIFVAPDGADLIENIAANETNSNILRGRPDAYNVGYAGSLHPGKGLALITRIAKTRPEYDFHVVGGNRKQVQKLETTNTLKNVYFYGHRDHAQIPRYLKAFDVCVAPYQHRALIRTGRNASRWISPMKVFEYMAAQKPVICSNLPVLQNILKHSKNAILLPSSDEDKWAQAIDELKAHPDLARRLAMNGYESLKNHYTWDKRVEAIISFSVNGRPTLEHLSA